MQERHELISRLDLAINTGDITNVNNAINNDAKVSERSLELAIKSGCVVIVNTVIAAGAKVSSDFLNLIAKYGDRHILEAVINGREQILEKQLDLNINFKWADLLSTYITTIDKPSATSMRLSFDFQYKIIAKAAQQTRVDEIKKNARTIASLQTNTNSFFSKLPPEICIQITSGMGKNPNKIEHNQNDYDIAFNSFNT